MQSFLAYRANVIERARNSFAKPSRRGVFVALTVMLTAGQFLTPGLVQPASASGLSTNFFDYANHDVATSGAGMVDWANNGALTSPNTVGATWTRAGAQGVFDGGVYMGSTKPPTAPGLTATATALKASGAIQDATFLADPISSDANWTCQSPSGPVTVSNDTTTFAGSGSETNNGQLSTFTYGTAGNTPPKDDLSNVYALSHLGASTNEIFFGGERIVNNGASHIDFEFLQAGLTIPNACAGGTMTGHRTQRDLLLSTDFTNGGALAGAQLYSWSCNGTAPTAAGYDASKDGTVCDPPANGNPGNGDPQYVAIPSQNGATTVASFGVNTGANGITCGGWVCRDATGAGTPTLLQNAFMEGGIDLTAAGFHGCINTFLPHTRSSPSFTSVLKDFAGPIKFSNCKSPTITTAQSSSGVTSGASITVGVGSSVTDTATLHGTAFSVGGTVTYNLYTDANCTQLAPNGNAGTKTVNGSPDANGDLVLPSSDAVTVGSTGTYYWQAAYSGDIAAQGSNQAVTSACGDEVLTVVGPSLSITKTADAPTVSAGDSMGFTIAISNGGAGTATGVTISDALPGGNGVDWSISPAYAGPGTCSITGVVPTQSLSCNIGTLGSGGSASVHVTSATARVSCGTYPNSATVAATNNATVPPATASITVDCPNVTLLKTADDSAVSAGANIGFTITVGNSGPGTAKSVTLSDPLPAGAGISWSISPAYAGPGTCGIAAGALTCSFDDMASGASTQVHVTSATAFASCATYPNTASAHATNNPQVQASASTAVQCPGLQITKTPDATPVNAGEAIGFTVTVSNTGVGTASGVTLSDPLPGGSGVDWSISPAYAGAGSCSITGSAPNQTLNCSFGDMASSASNSVHVTSATGNASCGAYPNTATATATNDGSVEASTAITVNCPNVTILKTADANTVNAGSNIGFTITVGNTGAGTAKSVTMSDPLPTGAGVSWSIDPAYAGPGTCGIAAGTLTCSFGDMTAGTSTVVHVSSATTFASCATYPNTATAQAANNAQVQASASTTVQCPALQITKTADATSVSAGDAIGFTVTVSSTGAGSATGVTLLDPLPGGNGVDWSISPAYAGVGSCSIAGSAPSQTLSCTFGDMAPSTSNSVHVTSGTTTASCGAYPNTATAAATNHGSVEASASISVDCPNVTITKTADDPIVSAGADIGFTVTVGNTGTGTAKSVSLSDPLPTGAGVSWSISPAYAGPGTCGIAADTLSCNFGDMASQASAQVHVTSATTFESCAQYPNTATATASNHPQVQASASTTVDCPDLSITKTADATPVNAGDPIGFTVTVSNAASEGTGTAKAVMLDDPLPSGNGVDWSIDPAYAGPGTCSITGSVASQTLACAFGDMAPGDSVSVHIASGTTAKSAGDYPNTATASASNAPPVDASATIVVLAPALSITKVADATTVTAGDPIGFTVTVANADAEQTGTAKAVTLSDPLPSGDGVSWSIHPAYSGPGSCSINGSAPDHQTLSCTFGDMAPGDSASVHISSQTTAASAGDYPNTATASASNAPPVDATATIKVVADVPVVTQGPPVTTTPPPTTTTVAPPQLPRTGAPTAWLAGLGLALIAAGAALAQSRKRRRNEVV